MDPDWWSRGEACPTCEIVFCHPHRPGTRHRQVWVGPHPTAYHTSPLCGAAPQGVKARARGVVVMELDLDGGGAEGVVHAQPHVPPGWKRVDETEAVARGLPACLRC